MLKCYDLKCEGLVSPMGVDKERPRFSWKIKSDKPNTVQTEYEIIIDGLWHKRIKSEESLFIEYDGLPLKAKTKYIFCVRVWDNNGEVSQFKESFFITGYMGEKPVAEWIGEKEESDKLPQFIKKLSCRTIKNAYIMASAYGLYEIYINDKKVGDNYLTPGYTSYYYRLQYQMYDVSDILKSGENEIRIMLGKGWCCGRYPFERKPCETYKKDPCVMLELHINGEMVLKTDEEWKRYDSPVLFSEIYDGETYDSRLLGKYENEKSVKIFDYGFENLVWNSGAPVKISQRLPAQKILKTPKGETVIDFGQNMSGWVEIKTSGKTGDKIRYIHAEVLDKDGNFYYENMRTAKNTIEFILNGEKNQILRPHFTFQGFRYIRIEECDFEIKKENFTACVLHSDINVSGKLKSSNPLLDRLFENVLWGQRSNFVDIPTDCPQRDERLGWTGDAQVFFKTAVKNADVYAFFRKWLYDMKTDQTKDGSIQFFIPAPKELNGDEWKSCSSAWGDASTVCSWNLYKSYGDKELLKELYPMMKKWVLYIKSTGDNEYIWDTGFQYGDWLSLDAEGESTRGGTDRYFIASAFFAYSTSILIKAAEELGYDEDVKEFTELYKNVIKEFKKTYLDKNELPLCKTQTAYSLLLYMDLTNNKSEAAKQLNKLVISCKTRLNTGFVGTPYLCFVLSQYGYLDTAYSLLLRTEYPSWLYPVTKGATTIWERWDGIRPDGTMQDKGMNSFNHYAYGCIADWIYSEACGIRMDKYSVAYKNSIISPKPDKRLKNCYCEFETAYGKIASGWEYKNNRIIFIITIPCNTTSKIILPNGETHYVGSGNHTFEISI